MSEEKNARTDMLETEELTELLYFLHDKAGLTWRMIAYRIGVDYTVIMKWKDTGSWGASRGLRIAHLAQEFDFNLKKGSVNE